jgi:hypothetical protein
VSTVRKKNCTSIQLHVDGRCVGEPSNVAEALTKHFYTTCSHILPLLSPTSVLYSAFLPLVPMSDLDIQKAFERLKTNQIYRTCRHSWFYCKGIFDHFSACT